MRAKNITYLSSLVVLPFVFAFFYSIRVLTRGLDVNELLPGWHILSTILGMIVLERVFKYERAVSQKPVLARDVVSTLTNIYVTGAVATIAFSPVLLFLPEYFFGRSVFFSSPDQLGPFWLQALMAIFLISFLRYWIHRLQHINGFLWKLHSYHHRVTNLQASNLLVSHPIDFALRNVLPFVVLGLVGFDPLAILVGVTALTVSSNFSHCGADVKGGFLNYIFVTPEIHRWHHSTEIPSGYRYSVNYGVGFILWDQLFGTYYLPKKHGLAENPKSMGHPDGLTDESNYLKLLLVPLGLFPSSGLAQRPHE